MHKSPLRKPLANLNRSNAGGSSLRRSLLVASTPVVKSKNNDEEERIQRRNNAEMQRRISSIGLNRSITSDTEMSDSKMQDHFQQCVRLYAENKINTKNAWNLQIIEYLRKILDKEQFESGDSLQMASTSLDIGSKVYGLRVDDIHNEIMKLASNMARINLEQPADNDDENAPEADGSDNEDAEAQKKKEKRRKRRVSLGDENSQLVNEESIMGKLTNSTAYNRNDSGKQRLYTLSAMRTLKCGDEQLVSCRSKVRYWATVTETLNMRPISGLVGVNIPPAKGTLCPSFADFAVDEWEPQDDLLLSQSRPPEEVVYDEHGFPVPEMDRSMHNCDDADDDHLSDIEEELNGEAHAGLRAEVAHITDMRPGHNAASGKLEYSYREPPVISERYLLTGVWAGPSHWKVKCIQRTATSTIVHHARAVRKRVARAAPVPINFYLNDEQFEKLIKPNRGRFVKTLQQENRITYPEDLRITQREVRTLFLKPDCYLESDTDDNEQVTRIDHNITNYEYDNPNDAEYCNDTLQGDALDAGGSDNDAEPPAEEAEDNGSFLDDNMVNMPNLVQKSHVPYATQAKKVDMRKLKGAIVKTVLSQAPDTAEMYDSDNDSEELLDNCKFTKVSFCKVYEALPTRLNSRLAEEISCPLAFVALLHLCNERTLQLDGQDDLLDVLISKN